MAIIHLSDEFLTIRLSVQFNFLYIIIFIVISSHH